MPKTALVISTALLCSLLTAGIGDRGLDAELTQRYGDKVLCFRHFFRSNSQDYDADGKVSKNLPRGPWTFYGQMQVKKIFLSEDKLRLEGNRVIYRFDESAERLIPVLDQDKIKVTIRLSRPLGTVEEASAILGKVFAVTEEERLDLVPPEWRHYLAAQPIAPGGTNDLKDDDLQNPKTEKVFHVGDHGVSPPKLLSRLDPVFPPPIRHETFHGTVGLTVIVDNNGKVRNIKVVHPVGQGLDESAVEAVKHWRFRPATKDGVPVNVAVYIEVDFHLN
jgi:TonB family protein